MSRCATRKIARFGVALLVAGGLSACGNQQDYHHSVYMLVDTSGTYSEQVGKAQNVVNYLLGTLQPGDSLAVARVKSRSFSEKDIVAKVALDTDPMQVTAQKKAFAEKINQFAKSTGSANGSRYTDISGGVIQGAEFLRETGAGRKTIIIFSDMQEELDYKTVRDFPIKLDGIRIIALNVTKLETDNIDPRRYIDRLDWWEQRALAAGASEWKVVNDMEHLDRVFSTRG
ncbi:MAG: histidine kinase [Betaproteobacteria bacterium SG8_40]|nr:MAG: histidine kinase [Betaproteobacteria bacterium SG8_40]